MNTGFSGCEMSRVTELPKTIFGRFRDGLQVRRSTREDLPAVLSLLGQMHEDEVPVRTAEDLAATFEEMLASPARALLVAVLDDTAVGTLDLFVMANLTRGGRPWAGIENMVVDAAHRQQGIGGALMEVAIDAAREVGCYKVQLISHEKRDAAHMLYKRAGFDAPVTGYRRYLDP